MERTMTQIVKCGSLLMLVACNTAKIARLPARQDQATQPPAAMAPSKLAWNNVANSPGEQIALLVGDPALPGDYSLRRRFPPGHQTRSHWHPHAEYGTVISGIFYIGFGEVASRSHAIPLGPGGFIRVPPNTPHFSFADEEVIVQVHGPGPRTTYYVHETPLPRQ